ncbi:hypothetical protein A2U01_0040512, partial [Trifolium medium]|nr:hypothetical protein [Trifolium medium]
CGRLPGLQSVVHDRMSRFNSIEGLLLGWNNWKAVQTQNGHNSEVQNNTKARQLRQRDYKLRRLQHGCESTETEGLQASEAAASIRDTNGEFVSAYMGGLSGYCS